MVVTSIELQRHGGYWVGPMAYKKKVGNFCTGIGMLYQGFALFGLSISFQKNK